jgi:hypothetical protein
MPKITVAIRVSVAKRQMSPTDVIKERKLGNEEKEEKERQKERSFNPFYKKSFRFFLRLFSSFH